MSNNEKDYILEFDEQGASCKRPDGSTEQVKWEDVVKVTLEATGKEAKEAPDHIWILWGKDNASGCVYPGGATGTEMMLVEMQSRFKDFDVGAVAQALKSEENKTWLLWQAASSGTNRPEDDGFGFGPN